MSTRGVIGYLRSTGVYKLPRDELEAYQLRKLGFALKYAFDTNKVWNETFKRVGLDPNNISRLSDLRRLPTVSKADMMRVQDAAREAGMLEGMKVVMSSGTTGTPSGFARGKGRSEFNRVLMIRTNMLHGLRPWTRVATLWAPQKYWKREVADDGSSRPYTGIYNNPLWRYRKLLRNLMTMWVDPMDPVGDGKVLAEFNPEMIFSRPSHLRRIARHCGSDLKVRPKVIQAAGEIMTETSFKDLRDAYGAKVVRQYGSSDVGKLGTDCLFETGIHVWEDYRIYEVLKDGEQVSPGEVGELVVTNLEPDSIPFIRFRTGDYVRLGDADRCDCGTCMRRLRAIEGREGDWIIGRDDEKVLALEVADHLESAFSLRDFQLLQTGLHSFTLLLRVDDLERYHDSSGIAVLRAYLEEITGAGVELKVEQRSDEDYWLKTRPVVCKLAPPVRAVPV